MRSPNVLTIGPGVPVLQLFVDALLAGAIVEPTWRTGDPLAFADLTIYVPTQRAATELADVLVARLGRPTAVLPRIKPLGALDDAEAALLLNASDPLDDGPALPAAVGAIERRMMLARLVLGWSRALRHAIVRVGGDGRRHHDPSEPCLVGTSALDAWHLAGALGRLIDELIIEGVDWHRLDPLVLPEFDDYWRITTDFLNIAVAQWPEALAARGLVDPARRQRTIVAAQCARVAGDRGAPIVALGSTGSHRATAELLAAIARAPHGAVVLPGLDLDMDDATWALLATSEEGETNAGHPQATLARLLGIIGVPRRDVRALDEPAPALQARRRFVSEALRPAETTDGWRAFRLANMPFDPALAGMTLVEAADEREEALALAVAMRESLDRPGGRTMLVTPDRTLARRVGAELRRWGIHADDTAGATLRTRPAGRLAELLLAAATPDPQPAALAALLVASGFGLATDGEAVADLEIGILRARVPVRARRTSATWLAAARVAATTRDAHPAQRRMTPDRWERAAALLERLLLALEPLAGLAGVRDVATWCAALGEALARSAADGAPLPDADVLEDLLAEAARCGDPELTFDRSGFARFFADLADEVRLPAPSGDPRLQIVGLLEARLLPADLVLLGGLDEQIWPPGAAADPFLNRPMRADLGLSSPERRIGQTAHDFTQALGAGSVVISRARKRGGVPTVSSRLLQRLQALAGPAWAPVVARGERVLALARALDRPPSAPASRLSRPMPRPPLALRPTALSVTRIETLRRDPYAIYADAILKLHALPALDAAAGAREDGTAVHAVVEAMTRAHPSGPVPAGAFETMIADLAERMIERRGDPIFAAFNWPRLVGAIDYFLRFDTSRRAAGAHIEVEARGRLAIPLPDGTSFTLTAVADRIERGPAGVRLVDFKTGQPPGRQEVFVGFAPQLTLEAAMVTRGAFGDAPGTPVEGADYVQLGGATGGETRDLHYKEESFATIAERHFAGLLSLLAQFRLETTAYPARPFPKFAARFNAYDHLARTGEWSMGGGEDA